MGGSDHPHRLPPEIVEWLDRELRHPDPLKLPRLPRMDAADPYPALAEGWRLAWHRTLGERKRSSHNAWKAPMRKTLATQIARWPADAPSPAAIAAIRFQDVVSWGGKPPRGPSVIYARVTPPVLRQARELQAKSEALLVPGGDASQKLRRTRHRLERTLRSERASNAADLRRILDRLGLDKDARRALRDAAEGELRASHRDLTAAARWMWIWL